MKPLLRLVKEARRRHVFRLAGIYIVAAWVVVQVADTAFPGLNVPDAAIRYVWLAALFGFPLALIFSWRYDVTSSGIVRTPPAGAGEQTELELRWPDFVLLALLTVVAAGVIYQSSIQIGDTRSTAAARGIERVIEHNSIAVLPLDNLSGNPEQVYFVDGMHEALIADLAKISGMKVISRVSTAQYRDSRKTAPEIGRELGVAYLLEGSVMRAENEVRITVQLIETAEDRHVWSESYQRGLADILDLQGSVARAIAGQVEVTLTPEENKQLSSSASVDPEAYELYLKGRFHWYRFSEADLKLALEYFQQSIDIDPGYSLAYVGFADALATPAHTGMMPPSQGFPAAKKLVERALELDENLAEAHDLLARIQFAYDWDWEAAERGFQRALSLKPGYPDVHVVYSQFLAIMNQPDKSLEEARIAVSLDPMNPWFQIEYAQRQAWYGSFDKGFTELISLIERHPTLSTANLYLWGIAATGGKFDVAAEAARNYFRLEGENIGESLIGPVGTEEEYRGLMRRLAAGFESNPSGKYMSNVELAKLRMHAGDYDAALDHLDNAYQQQESQLGYTTSDPLFEPVWRTSRFEELRRKLKLQP